MSVSQSRSRLGNAAKKAHARGTPLESDPAVLEARQDLTADKVAAYIDATVATAPRLRPDQIEALTRLLQQSATADASATRLEGGRTRAEVGSAWTAEHDQALVDKVAEGWTLTELTTHFGVPKSEISWRITRLSSNGVISTDLVKHHG
ncbi:hypothetical protein [Ornithinimicrobium cryptoxanthini]|uniref:Uncharacterized protein n=1 Tax=Ornithinimicrobium cryptoxanthini TaxID=2934161 RepID=A0ABY4YFB8_9MICO|nr:hypothetical protein [Ornithinimicrobium cryptoxanthini]USQ75359.1 hypothetical protein NF557_12095 [Ornithinimicrobium cryptoxanthini]